MRLSHIKLAGFKTFADPTDIPVPSDLVGVVGPNGCGKSNVIDAVRWVLGESRASALRGESMQDVIFNGSATRKPVGRASVELIFDNSLGKAGGQWSSYAEISIKRVLQRDGESIYYTNNIHVRRRDIADIFLGTGIGNRGYAIIEQGMISRIIEAKPEELRVFLEEAAGVSKYRERRRETELRLADTHENLLRVDDIRQELEKQLQRLEEQAKVAGKFKDMQGQLSTAHNFLWLARKQEAATQRIRTEKEVERLELELEAETSCLRDAEKRLEEGRTQHYAASDSLHQGQGELYAANAEVARIEQQTEHLRENHQRIEQQITAAKNQIEHHEEQVENSAENLDRWRKELEQASLALKVGKEKVAAENEKLPQTESAFRLCQEKLSEIQRNLLLTEQAEQLEESHRAHAEKALQQLESRKERLLEEQGALPRPDDEGLLRLQKEVESTEVELKLKQESLTQTENLLPNAEEVKHEIAHETQAMEQQITQTEAQFFALERLQHRLEDNQGLSEWLTKHQLNALPRLWQSIQIEKGWEDALESVLRERLNSSSLERLEVAQDWVGDTPPGKWTLFEATASSIQTPKNETFHGKEGWKSLDWYLTCDDTGIKSVLGEWLSGIFVVESVQDGLLQRTKLVPGEMLVTREGHLFTRHSLTYYAPDSQLHGVLVRQREITQIKGEVEKLRISLTKKKSELVIAEEDCNKLGALVSCLRLDSEKLQQQLHDLQMQTLKLTQLAERSSQRDNQISVELMEIRQQIDVEASQKQSAEAKLMEYKDQILVLQGQVEQEEQAGEVAEKSLNSQRQLVQNVVREMQEAAFYEKTCQNKIIEVESAILSINENFVTLKANLERLKQDQDSFDEATLHNQLQEWLKLREQREQVLTTARNTLEDAAKGLQEIEQERITFEQKLHPLRESISQACLKEQEARITENQFGEQLKEAGADEEELLRIIGKKRPSKLQAEINQLNTEIDALGAVNLAALEELHAFQERKAYLDSQSNDLKEAVETMESAIRRIDRETRERLLETFDKVNGHLDEMFPTLFGGGKAKLILSGEEILDSGVQIIAQPPGKKNSSIHLLSGGEKALTALALVFSLFKLNPAPFCLLDEVDAPLDDNNTERFCDLLRKMSNQTQFVFVSHNKITMEMAKHLIGVTMQEQGVSRVVAVDLEEAVKLSEVAEVG
ncbi:MAG: chromosome segregation protein SMC [Betaproteobacteria bacterium]|nr:MAG: chromosome segregation protein SMC [Betaproteobacteria bacterium]